MNIILTGFRGSGKTVVGRKLSDNLGLKFIDTDEEIERDTGKSIALIFETNGEPRFRELEKEYVLKACGLDRHVIAVGGGTVENGELATALKRAGLVILLKASTEVLHKRITQDVNSISRRPALTKKEGLAEIEELLERRRDAYHNCAHLEIETEGLTPAEVADVIVKKLKTGTLATKFSQIIS